MGGGRKGFVFGSLPIQTFDVSLQYTLKFDCTYIRELPKRLEKREYLHGIDHAAGVISGNTVPPLYAKNTVLYRGTVDTL